MAEFLTKEQIEAKAKQLSEQLGVKVTPMEFYTDEAKTDQIVGFLKDPPRLAKIRALDSATITGAYSSGEQLLEVCLIPEASDPRISSQLPEYDAVYIGACYAASELVQLLRDQFKKK